MYDQNPATIPDLLTTKLAESMSCLSKAGSLLANGVSVFDAEVHGWLIGASDELIETELDIEPGSVRHQVLLAIAAIERRDAAASEIVIPDAVWSMHRELREMFEAHTRFFANESECVPR
jgi:hypothetical protein